ncbi:hypothetical protein JHW43_006023 [Diplocarpon mali]|nr:hypothetical protein JHW43_006023 [Diplocarpon mali]
MPELKPGKLRLASDQWTGRYLHEARPANLSRELTSMGLIEKAGEGRGGNHRGGAETEQGDESLSILFLRIL